MVGPGGDRRPAGARRRCQDRGVGHSGRTVAARRPDRPRELFREATELAEQPLGTTPREAYARGFLAWTLAPFDPPAALALLERVPENARDRALGNVAHQLGAVNPQESERQLDS